MRFINKWLKFEGGQSIILVAFTIAMLCGVAALVVDTSQVSVTQGQLQNAADAAALAAANDLPSASAASATADAYAEMNGVSAANTTATTPYKGNSNKVEVVCTKTVQYTFARILGFNSKVVTARAVAEKTGMSGGCFGYALFAGSTDLQKLMLTTSNLEVTGNTHANGSVFISGSNQEFTGNVEGVSKVEAYVSNITITGTCQAANLWVPDNTGAVHVGNRVATAAANIPMPDLSAGVKSEAIASGTAYMINEWETQVFSGNGINIDKSIYVNGGITIAGSSFKGQGAICAKKNIGISGNTLKGNAGTSVCIYSVEGDINLSASGLTIYGTLYAPNGRISINMSNITIYGRVIAKEIQISGSNVEIISGSGDLGFLPGGSVALCE
ncbi:MAG: pilus assembly protein TadG-related protein [Christensenella sp.]|nr:pilus assembly protein TadG-related protein [Christensenella sp.]